MKDIIRIIGVSLLSSFLIFIGKNDLFLNFLVKNEVLSSELNINDTQFYLFIIGIFWAGLWLPIEHSRLKTKFKKKENNFMELLKYNKENYFRLIKKELKEHNASFKTRIFKPKRGIIGLWHRLINKKTILELKTIKGISDDFHHKSLQFEVNSKQVQGLVGQSYKTESLCVDLNLEENDYQLTQKHITKIGNVEFCSTIPIFNKDQSKVIAIVSIDSQNKLNFDDAQKKVWEEHMIYYAAFVDKHTNI